jgi:hypothetical protein
MGGGSKTTTSTTVDPQMLALYMQNYANANAVAGSAFQPYAGELVAPTSVLQAQGQQMALNAANDSDAVNTLNNALAGTNNLLRYQAPVISAPAAVNLPSVAPSTIAPPGVSASAVTPTSIAAGQLATTDLTPYLNPYTNDVVDTTLSSLALARAQAQVSDNEAAAAAHAFGGTRAAVQNALTTNDYLRNVASTTANLNQGAYVNAQAAALADIANRLSASQANATNQLNAGEFNATSQLDAAKFNANALLNANEFNATGAYNAAAANAANSLAGANLRMNAASLLGNLSNDQLNQALARAGAVESVGAQQTAQQQAIDQAAYQEFLRQAQFPIEQQQLRNQALTEIPLAQTTTNSTHSSPGVLDVFNTLANVGSTAARMAG